MSGHILVRIIREAYKKSRIESIILFHLRSMQKFKNKKKYIFQKLFGPSFQALSLHTPLQRCRPLQRASCRYHADWRLKIELPPVHSLHTSNDKIIYRIPQFFWCKIRDGNTVSYYDNNYPGRSVPGAWCRPLPCQRPVPDQESVSALHAK